MTPNSFLSLIKEDALLLLKSMIQTPSFSKEEDQVSTLISDQLTSWGIAHERKKNNLWSKDPHWDDNKPTILFNSHIDTVQPSKDYTMDPFGGEEVEDKIIGLGSNDAGASVVSQLAAFRYLSQLSDRTYNLIWSATAEEEISGKNGVEFLLPKLGNIDLAIVGEPTQLDIAVAEKGLMVIDATVEGVAGHAARDEGDNAIYKAIKDIDRIEKFVFDKESDVLGPVKATVTMVNAGTQHNVVPDRCTFVIDIRSNGLYANKEILEILQNTLDAKLRPRSTRLNASNIPLDHPMVKRCIALGSTAYGSPTMSDQALMSCPSIKLGPGDSARSHTANEFIYKDEILNGIEYYIKMLEGFSF
ncbi:M20 family metallo-hydrolase [Halosquirtibacter xylanolyticus]|uniref:M20 family metallo-hydrolase n=1 Tax=Halosquirtibacter xylanolyticus TaxID=3374599 RepID=UPI003747E61F|nr:M20 family metallo-hydrolase [Prolixibacteraceae bacterium]